MKNKRTPNRTATRKPVDATTTSRGSRGRQGYRPQRLVSDPRLIPMLLERGEPIHLLTLLPTLIFLDHLHHHGLPGNACLEAAHSMRVTYTALGVPVEIKPVRLEVHGAHGGNAYGSLEPHFTEAGDFAGHCVLRFPTLDRFLDATIGQFPDVARRDPGPMLGRTAFTLNGEDPGAGPWPAGARLSVSRKDLELRYVAVDPAHDATLFSGPAAGEDFLRGTLHNGLALLGQTVATLASDDDAAARARSASIAPHLPVLLDAVAGAEWTPEPGEGDHFTRDGATIRLRDLVDLTGTGFAHLLSLCQ
ncbi:hypothetical protein CLV92_12029 [Kineococcus xinjiangensis]|uniref:Uncharacterized protein n=1 Tax=Kineococcus xinjiangensis TaxID=512762 RepID=A0A2S6ICM1_9ACTN|nr:hypothetical protein [Kineococcus xinjiangensis]PPK91910.1 hypothetical protein CLV92_12029 [Kineococcus xinjiangensis]